MSQLEIFKDKPISRGLAQIYQHSGKTHPVTGTALCKRQCYTGHRCNTSRLGGQDFIYLHVMVLNWTHSTGNRQNKTRTWILKFQEWNLSSGKHLGDSSRKITKLQGQNVLSPFPSNVTETQEEFFLVFNKHAQKVIYWCYV